MSKVDWKGGMRLTQKRMRDITPEWETWDPEWTTTSGSNTPSFGSADVTAEYVEHGGLCQGKLIITFAGDTDFGGGGATDNWQFSLPVEASATSLMDGWGSLQHSGTSERLYVRARFNSTTTMLLEVDSGYPDGTGVTTPGVIDATTPETWASGHRLTVFFAYETAS